MKNITIIIFLTIIAIILTPSVYAATASLSLSPSTGTFNKGCQFSVDIKLDTGGAKSDGADAVILYEPTKLTTDTSSITSGTLYAEYPGSSVREDLSKISISGLASVTTAFAGAGTLATIKFTVKPDAVEGPTTLKFDFDSNDKAKTTDSNVVERDTHTEVLNSVVNGNYTIGAGTCGAKLSGAGIGGVGTPSAGIAPPGGPGGGTKGGLPGGGTAELTYTIAILGSALTVLGILGLVLL